MGGCDFQCVMRLKTVCWLKFMAGAKAFAVFFLLFAENHYVWHSCETKLLFIQTTRLKAHVGHFKLIVAPTPQQATANTRAVFTAHLARTIIHICSVIVLNDLSRSVVKLVRSIVSSVIGSVIVEYLPQQWDIGHNYARPD